MNIFGNRFWSVTKSLVSAGVLTSSLAAWAVPTQSLVYRDDQSGLTVYRDSDDASLFWFVPAMRALEENGKTKVIRQAKGGRVQYLFYVVPSLPADVARQVAASVPGISSTSQLRPVQATKVGMSLPMFSAMATSTGVTDAQYLNQPQLMRLDLTRDDAAEFDALYAGAPGVPVQMLIAYTGQRRSKFLEISLSCKEVAKALDIGASGNYTFIGADIAYKVSNYLANKSLQIRNQGDISMPEVMESVVKACFRPQGSGGRPAMPAAIPPMAVELGQVGDLVTVQPGVEWGGAWGHDLTPTKSTDVIQSKEYDRRAKLEMRLREVAIPLGDKDAKAASFYRTLQRRAGSADASQVPAIDMKAQFTFKREVIAQDQTVFVKREEFIDSLEVATRMAYLTARPEAAVTRVVAPLPQRQVRVTIQATAGNPLRTGLYVQPGDSYTITAGFALAAKSPYGKDTRAYRWDATWPKPDGDLYFRVGDGPWRSVGGRGLIGPSELGTGEIQLYLDRAALWNRVPKEFREATMLGLVPAVFPYSSFYPEFVTTLSGRRVVSIK